jgi:hypothetical protein
MLSATGRVGVVMKSWMWIFRVGLLGAGLTLLGSRDTRAGAGPNDFAVCVTTPGTSFCYGSLAGFRQDADPDAEAGFESNGSFSAHLNGQLHSCAVSSTLYPQVLALWPQTTSFHGYFFIGWDQQGFCSTLSFFNGSEFF